MQNKSNQYLTRLMSFVSICFAQKNKNEHLYESF